MNVNVKVTPELMTALFGIVEAAKEARTEMVNRQLDLRWCSKEDDCHARSLGAEVVIDDYDQVMAPRLAALEELLDERTPDQVADDDDAMAAGNFT